MVFAVEQLILSYESIQVPRNVDYLYLKLLQSDCQPNFLAVKMYSLLALCYYLLMIAKRLILMIVASSWMFIVVTMMKKKEVGVLGQQNSIGFCKNQLRLIVIQ